jgi:hypothetical protein
MLHTATITFSVKDTGSVLVEVNQKHQIYCRLIGAWFWTAFLVMPSRKLPIELRRQIGAW